MAYIIEVLQGRLDLTRRLATEIVTGFLYGYATPPACGAGRQADTEGRERK